MNHHANHALLVELAARISGARKLGATHLQLEWAGADWLMSLAYVAVTTLPSLGNDRPPQIDLAGTSGRWDYLDEMESLKETRLMFDNQGGQALLSGLFASSDEESGDHG